LLSAVLRAISKLLESRRNKTKQTNSDIPDESDGEADDDDFGGGEGPAPG
jgi:hypothetical protein